jgi:hypothetical protein
VQNGRLKQIVLQVLEGLGIISGGVYGGGGGFSLNGSTQNFLAGSGKSIALQAGDPDGDPSDSGAELTLQSGTAGGANGSVVLAVGEEDSTATITLTGGTSGSVIVQDSPLRFGNAAGPTIDTSDNQGLDIRCGDDALLTVKNPEGYGLSIEEVGGTNTVLLDGNPLVLQSGGTRKIVWCTGTPEGAISAGIGSLALRMDGGANTTLYVKESGTGNTGWVAK